MEKETFKYPNTNSSRAKIEYLERKFKNQRIAIVGLGGTGAYILDLVAKTPVKEIHLFDADFFQLHNAFRAPGATNGEKFEVEGGIKKVNYYHEIYSNMHAGIVPHDIFITSENVQLLSDFDYVFVCVDKNKARSMITESVIKMNGTFIDVGMGINKLEDSLIGSMRVTVGTKLKHDHLHNRIGEEDFGENEYATNIQIAELNCLNAVYAVIKWKKLCGFYQDLKQEHNSLYFINTGKLLNEDNAA